MAPWQARPPRFLRGGLGGAAGRCLCVPQGRCVRGADIARSPFLDLARDLASVAMTPGRPGCLSDRARSGIRNDAEFPKRVPARRLSLEQRQTDRGAWSCRTNPALRPVRIRKGLECPKGLKRTSAARENQAARNKRRGGGRRTRCPMSHAADAVSSRRAGCVSPAASAAIPTQAVCVPGHRRRCGRCRMRPAERCSTVPRTG